MSIQVIGDGFETGLCWSAVRLANEDQLNGGWGVAAQLFNDNHFSSTTHSEIFANWIASLGDKNLRFNDGTWNLYGRSSNFDSSNQIYTMSKALPRPDERGLPTPPADIGYQGVFIGGAFENGGLTLAISPLVYNIPSGVDGLEINNAILQPGNIQLPLERNAAFSVYFESDHFLSFNHTTDRGWVSQLTENGKLGIGVGVDGLRRFELLAPAIGNVMAMRTRGEGYGISLTINAAGTSYGVEVVPGTLNGGSGDYPLSTTVVNVPVTGGDGEDTMTVDIDTDGGGIVTAVRINKSGNGGYRSGNILTIDNSGGAGGTSASFESAVSGQLNILGGIGENNLRQPFISGINIAGDTYTPNSSETNGAVTKAGNSLGHTNQTDVTNMAVQFSVDGAGVIIPSTLEILELKSVNYFNKTGVFWKTGDKFTVNGSGGTPLEFEVTVLNRGFDTIAVGPATGTDVAVDIVHDINGAVTAVFPRKPGSGYTGGDQLQVLNEPTDSSGTAVMDITAGTSGIATSGGTGTGMTVNVTTDADGKVLTATVASVGDDNYVNGDILTVLSGDNQATFGILFIDANTAFLSPQSWDRHFFKTWRDSGVQFFKIADRNKEVVSLDGTALPFSLAQASEVYMFGGTSGRGLYDDMNIWNTESGDNVTWTAALTDDDFESHRRWMGFYNKRTAAGLPSGTGYATGQDLAVTVDVSSGTGMKVDIVAAAGVIQSVRIIDNGDGYDHALDTFTVVQGGGSGGTFTLDGNMNKSLGAGANWTTQDTWIDTGGELNDANFQDVTDGRKSTFAKSTSDRFGFMQLQSFEQMGLDVGYTIESIDGFAQTAWRVTDPQGEELVHIVQDPSGTEISKQSQGAVGEEGMISEAFFRGEAGFDGLNPQKTDFGYDFLMKRP